MYFFFHRFDFPIFTFGALQVLGVDSQEPTARLFGALFEASDHMRRSWKPPIAIGLFRLESAPEGDDTAARPEDWMLPPGGLGGKLEGW